MPLSSMPFNNNDSENSNSSNQQHVKRQHDRHHKKHKHRDRQHHREHSDRDESALTSSSLQNNKEGKKKHTGKKELNEKEERNQRHSPIENTTMKSSENNIPSQIASSIPSSPRSIEQYVNNLFACSPTKKTLCAAVDTLQLQLKHCPIELTLHDKVVCQADPNACKRSDRHDEDVDDDQFLRMEQMKQNVEHIGDEEIESMSIDLDELIEHGDDQDMRTDSPLKTALEDGNEDKAENKEEEEEDQDFRVGQFNAIADPEKVEMQEEMTDIRTEHKSDKCDNDKARQEKEKIDKSRPTMVGSNPRDDEMMEEKIPNKTPQQKQHKTGSDNAKQRKKREQCATKIIPLNAIGVTSEDPRVGRNRYFEASGAEGIPFPPLASVEITSTTPLIDGKNGIRGGGQQMKTKSPAATTPLAMNDVRSENSKEPSAAVQKDEQWQHPAAIHSANDEQPQPLTADEQQKFSSTTTVSNQSNIITSPMGDPPPIRPSKKGPPMDPRKLQGKLLQQQRQQASEPVAAAAPPLPPPEEPQPVPPPVPPPPPIDECRPPSFPSKVLLQSTTKSFPSNQQHSAKNQFQQLIQQGRLDHNHSAQGTWTGSTQQQRNADPRLPVQLSPPAATGIGSTQQQQQQRNANQELQSPSAGVVKRPHFSNDSGCSVGTQFQSPASITSRQDINGIACLSPASYQFSSFGSHDAFSPTTQTSQIMQLAADEVLQKYIERLDKRAKLADSFEQSNTKLTEMATNYKNQLEKVKAERDQYKSLKQENDALQKKIKMMQELTEYQQRRTEEEESQNTILKDELCEAENEAQHLRDKISHLEAVSSRNEKEKDDLKEKLQQMQTELKKQRELTTKKELENATALDTQRTQLESEMVVQRKKLEKNCEKQLAKQRNSLQKHYEKKFTSKKEKLRISESVRLGLEEDLHEKRSKYEQMKAIHEEVQNKLDEERQKSDAMRDQLVERQKEVMETKRKLELICKNVTKMMENESSKIQPEIESDCRPASSIPLDPSQGNEAMEVRSRNEFAQISRDKPASLEAVCTQQAEEREQRLSAVNQQHSETKMTSDHRKNISDNDDDDEVKFIDERPPSVASKNSINMRSVSATAQNPISGAIPSPHILEQQLQRRMEPAPETIGTTQLLLEQNINYVQQIAEHVSRERSFLSDAQHVQMQHPQSHPINNHHQSLNNTMTTTTVTQQSNSSLQAQQRCFNLEAQSMPHKSTFLQQANFPVQQQSIQQSISPPNLLPQQQQPSTSQTQQQPTNVKTIPEKQTRKRHRPPKEEPQGSQISKQQKKQRPKQSTSSQHCNNIPSHIATSNQHQMMAAAPKINYNRQLFLQQQQQQIAQQQQELQYYRLQRQAFNWQMTQMTNSRICPDPQQAQLQRNNMAETSSSIAPPPTVQQQQQQGLLQVPNLPQQMQVPQMPIAAAPGNNPIIITPSDHIRTNNHAETTSTTARELTTQTMQQNGIQLAQKIVIEFSQYFKMHPNPVNAEQIVDEFLSRMRCIPPMTEGRNNGNNTLPYALNTLRMNLVTLAIALIDAIQQ